MVEFLSSVKYSIDVLSQLVYSFFKPFSLFFDRDFHPNKIKKILILHNESIKLGDSILTTPVINSIKETFPHASIDVMVSPDVKPFFENNPMIDKIITSKYYHFKKYLSPLESKKLEKEKFDLVVNLSFSLSSNILALLSSSKYRVGWDWNGSGFCLTTKVKYPEPEKRTKHEVENYLDIIRSIGIRSQSNKPRIFTSSNQKKWAKNFLKKNKISTNKILIGVHPGAAFQPRAWPRERFLSVMDMITKKYDVNFLFFDELRENPRDVLPIKNIPLEKTLPLIESCDLFLCNDSGPMHMAAALNVPVIAIFGPQTPVKFGPIGEDNTIIYKKLPCSPCKQDFFNECKPYNNKPLCLHLIKTNEVFRAVENQIKKLI